MRARRASALRPLEDGVFTRVLIKSRENSLTTSTLDRFADSSRTSREVREVTLADIMTAAFDGAVLRRRLRRHPDPFGIELSLSLTSLSTLKLCNIVDCLSLCL